MPQQYWLGVHGPHFPCVGFFEGLCLVGCGALVSLNFYWRFNTLLRYRSVLPINLKGLRLINTTKLHLSSYYFLIIIFICLKVSCYLFYFQDTSIITFCRLGHPSNENSLLQESYYWLEINDSFKAIYFKIMAWIPLFRNDCFGYWYAFYLIIIFNTAWKLF